MGPEGNERQVKVGSLFSGIGGFDLAARWMGWSTAWHSEIDPHALKVFEQHFPDSWPVGDITEWKPTYNHRVDLICGGFPCLTTSQAGLRTGEEDERWLWPEMARVVGILRPTFVVVENPPGVLVRGGREILKDLAALGYRVEWEAIPAASLGAHHVRDRVWFVAYPNDGRHEVFRFTEPRRVWRQSRRFPNRCRAVWELRDAPPTSAKWAFEPDVGRVADGVPRRVDRLRGLGQAVVPQVAYWIFQRLPSRQQLQ